jgi:class 3 adenylate cyclase/CheY-like chemotaxis protein
MLQIDEQQSDQVFDDVLTFDDDADEDNNSREPWILLVVDDEEEIHKVTRYAMASYFFQEKSIRVISAYSGAEAREVIAATPNVAVILLDVVMESRDAGLRLVQFIRKELKNKFFLIVLRTGQPGEAPESDVIQEYDINDYKNKSELTNTKLLTTITTALRSFADFMEVERYRQRLEELVKERTHKLNDTLLQLSIEKTKADDLLTNILPASIAERMKNGERPIADHFNAVTVLFADIVGFTELASARTPQEIVMVLDGIFSEFDGLATKFGVEKVKTIGDTCMVVGGAPDEQHNHTEAIARMALEMLASIENFNNNNGTALQMRIGIHVGEVAAGVIGKQRFSYDMWGETVNVASSMESHGEAGKIHCTESVKEMLEGSFRFEARGMTEIKGKGQLPTYFLLGYVVA